MKVQLPKKLMPVECPELVRVGNKNDGGYVIGKGSLEAADFLLGFGINTDWSFEEEFVRSCPNNIGVHGYDHTVNSRLFYKTILKEIVDIPSSGNLSSIKRLGIFSDYKKFFGESSNQHFREKISWKDDGQNVSMDTVFSRLEGKKNIFLKIDIEGSEYRVFDQILEHREKIVGLAIEFHDTDLHEDRLFKIIDQIKEDFHLVHIHGNNGGELGINGFPVSLELSFERKDLFTGEVTSSKRSYPLAGIDAPNDPSLPDYEFVFHE